VSDVVGLQRSGQGHVACRHGTKLTTVSERRRRASLLKLAMLVWRAAEPGSPSGSHSSHIDFRTAVIRRLRRTTFVLFQ
jgi:hypothetical protein